VRPVIEGRHFAECVARLGGYRAIDLALETVIEAVEKVGLAAIHMGFL
jgi:hypothetical protein